MLKINDSPVAMFKLSDYPVVTLGTTDEHYRSLNFAFLNKNKKFISPFKAPVFDIGKPYSSSNRYTIGIKNVRPFTDYATSTSTLIGQASHYAIFDGNAYYSAKTLIYSKAKPNDFYTEEYFHLHNYTLMNHPSFQPKLADNDSPADLQSFTFNLLLNSEQSDKKVKINYGLIAKCSSQLSSTEDMKIAVKGKGVSKINNVVGADNRLAVVNVTNVLNNNRIDEFSTSNENYYYYTGETSNTLSDLPYLCITAPILYFKNQTMAHNTSIEHFYLYIEA